MHLSIEVHTVSGEEEHCAVEVLHCLVVEAHAVASAMSIARRSIAHGARVEAQSGGAAGVRVEAERDEAQALCARVRAPVVPQKLEAARRLVGASAVSTRIRIHFALRTRTQIAQRHSLLANISITSVEVLMNSSGISSKCTGTYTEPPAVVDEAP